MPQSQESPWARIANERGWRKQQEPEAPDSPVATASDPAEQESPWAGLAKRRGWDTLPPSEPEEPEAEEPGIFKRIGTWAKETFGAEPRRPPDFTDVGMGAGGPPKPDQPVPRTAKMPTGERSQAATAPEPQKPEREEAPAPRTQAEAAQEKERPKFPGSFQAGVPGLPDRPLEEESPTLATALKVAAGAFLPGKLGEDIETEAIEEAPRHVLQSKEGAEALALMGTTGRIARFPFEVALLKPLTSAVTGLSMAGQAQLLARLTKRFPQLLRVAPAAPTLTGGARHVVPGAAAGTTFGAGITGLEAAGDIAAGVRPPEALKGRAKQFAHEAPGYAALGGGLGMLFGSVAAELSSREMAKFGQSSTSKPVNEAFRILGLTPEATEAEIMAARRNLSMKYHPDRPGGSDEAMAAVNNAADMALRYQRGQSGARGPTREREPAPREPEAREPTPRRPDPKESEAALKERAARIREEARRVVEEEATAAEAATEPSIMEPPRLTRGMPGEAVTEPRTAKAPPSRPAEPSARPTVVQDEAARKPFEGDIGDEAVVLPEAQRRFPGIASERVRIVDTGERKKDGTRIYEIQDADYVVYEVTADDLRAVGELDLEVAGQEQMFEVEAQEPAAEEEGAATPSLSDQVMDLAQAGDLEGIRELGLEVAEKGEHDFQKKWGLPAEAIAGFGPGRTAGELYIDDDTGQPVAFVPDREASVWAGPEEAPTPEAEVPAPTAPAAPEVKKLDDGTFAVLVDGETVFTAPTMAEAAHAAVRIEQDPTWRPPTTEEPAEAPEPTAPEEAPVEGPVEEEAGPAEEVAVEERPVPASPDDIPIQTAIDAHKGTSWTPERRGEGEQQQYMNHMESVWKSLRKLPRNAEEREALLEGFKEYRQGYKKRYLAYLRARGQVLSPMVAGPAKFPGEANRKRSQAADNKLNELVKWADKKQREIRKRIRPEAGPISADQENAPELIQKKLADREAFHEKMKEANKLIRKMGTEGEEVRTALLELGLKQKTVQGILQGDFAGRTGFPPYALANNRKEIKRLKQRLEQIEETRGRPALDGFEFEGGTIEEDEAANRLRIFFDEKPEEDVRTALKQNGFRWAPSVGAWQRKRGEAAFRAAEKVLGIEIPRPGAAERASAEEVVTPEVEQYEEEAPQEVEAEGAPVEPVAEEAPEPEPEKEPLPWEGAGVEQEDDWYGVRVEVAPRDKTDKAFRGTVVKIRNEGRLVEVLPDDAARSTDWERVESDRITLLEEPEADQERVEPTNELIQAAKDWLNQRAYIDNNGNYHLRPKGKITGKGPMAPWNKAVKAAYPSGWRAFAQDVHRLSSYAAFPWQMDMSREDYIKKMVRALPTRGAGSRIRRRERKETAAQEWDSMAQRMIIEGRMRPSLAVSKGLSKAKAEEAGETYLAEGGEPRWRDEEKALEELKAARKEALTVLERLRRGDLDIPRDELEEAVKKALHAGQTIRYMGKTYKVEHPSTGTWTVGGSHANTRAGAVDSAAGVILNSYDSAQIQALRERYEDRMPEAAEELYDEAYAYARKIDDQHGYATRHAITEVARAKGLPKELERALDRLTSVATRYGRGDVERDHEAAVALVAGELTDQIAKPADHVVQLRDPEFIVRRMGWTGTMEPTLTEQIKALRSWLPEGEPEKSMSRPGRVGPGKTGEHGDYTTRRALEDADNVEKMAEAAAFLFDGETEVTQAARAWATDIRQTIEAQEKKVREALERLEEKEANLPQERAREAVSLSDYSTRVTQSWEGRITAEDSPILTDGRIAILRSAVPDQKKYQNKLGVLMRRTKHDGRKLVVDESHKIWTGAQHHNQQADEPAEIIGILPKNEEIDRPYAEKHNIAILEGEKGTLAIVDADYLKYLSQVITWDRIQLSEPERAIGFYQGDQLVAIQMPLRLPQEGVDELVDLDAMKAALAEEREGKAKSGGGGKGKGSFTSKADLPPPEEAIPATISLEPSTETLQPISPVELTRLAIQLLGKNRVFLKKYPRARGMFYADPEDPKLGLHPKLGQDYAEFAKTFAHEIGHLVDYLPDRLMQRGNILGRIASLQAYLKTTIDAEPTEPSRTLMPKDRAKIRRMVEKEVGPRPPKDEVADLAAWREEVSVRYRAAIEEEMDARNLIGRERIHQELLLLSEWWRPFDRSQASEGYIKYREGSDEIYADALSILLNSPGSLQERAPAFFHSFLAYMERKPEVKQTYEAIQKLIGQGEEAIYGARMDELAEDFERGERVTRESEEKGEAQSFLEYLKQALVSRASPVLKAEKERIGKQVPAHSAKHTTKMALQEFNHGDNVNRMLLEDLARKVHQPLQDLDLADKYAGAYMMLRRIAEGDRGGMAEQAKEAIMELTGRDNWPDARAAYAEFAEEGAEVPEGVEFDPALLELAESGVLNPHGYTPEEAQRTLDGMKRELGEEKFTALQEIIDKRLRPILFESVKEAVRVGSYNREVFETRIKPNKDTYAPFAVLDYFSGRMPAGIRGQVGTLGGVADPYTTAIFKTMSLNRLNEYQKAKIALLESLQQDFVDELGPERRIDKFHREKRPEPGKANLLYLKDGKLFYREVDEYIAKVLDRSDLGSLGRLQRTLSSLTYSIFHPLYVSWSLTWQARNLPRDWKRTYKNLAAAHAGKPKLSQAVNAILDLGRLNYAYMKTVKPAWANARRRYDPYMREMLEDRALGRAFHSFEPHEESPAIARQMERYGILKPSHKGVKGAAQQLGRPIEVLGVWQETWSKAAAYKVLGLQGITGKERAYIVRNYAGTPDTTDRGLASDASNALLMYSNVIVSGLRNDAEVAFQPSTASGYWFRSILMDFSWKAIQAAGILGLLGAGIQHWLQHIPDYDLETYTIIPVPPFYVRNERGETKAVYYRFPHDDANRILAATTWALFTEHKPYTFSHVVSILSGEFPGLNPALDLTHKWGAVASGVDPHDYFRGRPALPRTEFEAGGWPRAKEMLRYSLGEFGIVSQVLGHWIHDYGPEEYGDTGRAEDLFRAVPGLSALVKISDYGLDHRRWWEIEWETQERARLKVDLSSAVRKALSERSRLNRFGVERLTPQERSRRARLNQWYGSSYAPLTAVMEDARQRGDDERYKSMAERIDESLKRYRLYESDQ